MPVNFPPSNNNGNNNDNVNNQNTKFADIAKEAEKIIAFGKAAEGIAEGVRTYGEAKYGAKAGDDSSNAETLPGDDFRVAEGDTEEPEALPDKDKAEVPPERADGITPDSKSDNIEKSAKEIIAFGKVIDGIRKGMEAYKEVKEAKAGGDDSSQE